MKNLIATLIFIVHFNIAWAQTNQVGIGTPTPAAPLDVAGQNNWNLTNTEGDMRIGNNSYRIKFGIATGGAGAGAANIMQFGQPGGYNVLSLGSQGKQVLFLNGNTGNAGIGVSSPATPLQVAGTTTTSNLVLNGSGNGNANDFLIRSDSAGLVAARKGHGALGLNYIICVSGAYPRFDGSPMVNISILGEVKLFAGNRAPSGWMFCDGQIMDLANNTALFSILGTMYGGNGQTTFALPDLRGATPVGPGTPTTGNTWEVGERTN